MVLATFRFHEELNDFLPRARRNLAFSVPCARAATTKHMIEALGIPHTEVGRICVNAEDSGFERLLQQGDTVEIHPQRAGLATAGIPTPAPRFIADAHLGGLARLLRMAGFDTLYRNDYGDRELAALSVREHRILLTRDRELLKQRTITHGCFVHAQQPAQQLREIVCRLALQSCMHPFSLCLECNQPLRTVDKQHVLDRLPPSVRVKQTHFTRCDQCGRIYWPGSHWQRMQRMLQDELILPSTHPAHADRPNQNV